MMGRFWAIGVILVMVLLAYVATNVLMAAWLTGGLMGRGLLINGIVVVALDAVVALVAVRLMRWAVWRQA